MVIRESVRFHYRRIGGKRWRDAHLAVAIFELSLFKTQAAFVDSLQVVLIELSQLNKYLLFRKKQIDLVLALIPTRNEMIKGMFDIHIRYLL